ncbi:MAG: prephenate dehydratase [bacterium]
MAEQKNGLSEQQLIELRDKIDNIDEQIQELINSRAQIALKVGKAKASTGATVDFYRPEREAQVLRKVSSRNHGPLKNEEMVRLFREIMSACLAQQEPLKVAFLGPEGTFSQAAVFKQFGHSIRSLPLATIEEVFHELEERVADFGVVPVENSTEGSVHNTLDMFLTSPIRICGELELKITQNLLSRAGSLDQIERVYSHQQSLAQCRGWLRQHLPNAERIAVSSNAEAARRVRHSPDAAAIAGESAAELYGLNMLVEDIADKPDNTTRFLVIGNKRFAPSGDDKTSLLMVANDKPGALFHLLQPLSERGISMTKIESRPSKRGKWEYAFFVDVDGHADESPLKEAIEKLEPVASILKVLGSYPKSLV